MSKRFLLSPQVDQALDHCWDYYHDRGGCELADRMVGELREAFERLAEFPHRGHPRADLTSKPFLFHRVRGYLIVFDPATEPLMIFRLYHAAQDIKRNLHRPPR